jgi:hypothetical protein
VSYWNVCGRMFSNLKSTDWKATLVTTVVIAGPFGSERINAKFRARPRENATSIRQNRDSSSAGPGRFGFMMFNGTLAHVRLYRRSYRNAYEPKPDMSRFSIGRRGTQWRRTCVRSELLPAI